jgi:hypothetical protein
MTPDQFYAILEPSFIDRLDVDPRRRRVAVDVRVVNSHDELHSLIFEGVSRFQLERPGAVNWEETELSEVLLERRSSAPASWRFWAELWSSATLEIQAERILLDGEPVNEAAA